MDNAHKDETIDLKKIFREIFELNKTIEGDFQSRESLLKEDIFKIYIIKKQFI